MILVRKPRRTVTGLPPEVELVFELELADEEEDEADEQPASSKAAPTKAAVVTRRI